MSQAGQNSSMSGPINPIIPTNFVGNTGSATPAANILNDLGAGSITTVASGNTVTTQLTGLANNSLLFGQGTATLGQVTPVNNAILSTNGSGVPSLNTSLNNDYTFTSPTPAIARNLTVSNTDNTSIASQALVTTSVAGTAAGDAFFRAAIGNVRSYAFGTANGDSQSFHINTTPNGQAGPGTGSNLLRIDTSGNTTLPLNTCCAIDLAANVPTATGNGTLVNPVIFNSAFFDQNASFNTGTGVFTAHATGRYLVTVTITYSGLTAATTDGLININVNGGNFYIDQFNPGVARTSTNEYTRTVTRVISLSNTNTITVTTSVAGGALVVGLKGNSFGSYSNFSATLIS